MEIFAIIDCQEKSTAEMLCVKFAEKGNNVFVSKGFGLYGSAGHPEKEKDVIHDIYRVYVNYDNFLEDSFLKTVKGFEKTYKEISEEVSLPLCGEYFCIPTSYGVAYFP